jgi:phosphate transport system substrate-binding protein
MRNKDGVVRRPDDDTFAAAAANADWAKAPAFGEILTEQPGQEQLADHRRLLHSRCTPARKSRQRSIEVLKFFSWAYKNGQKHRDRPGLRPDAG